MVDGRREKSLASRSFSQGLKTRSESSGEDWVAPGDQEQRLDVKGHS